MFKLTKVSFDDDLAKVVYERIVVAALVINGVGLATLFGAMAQIDEVDNAFIIFLPAMTYLATGLTWAICALAESAVMLVTRGLSRRLALMIGIGMALYALNQFPRASLVLMDSYYDRHGFNGAMYPVGVRQKSPSHAPATPATGTSFPSKKD